MEEGRCRKEDAGRKMKEGGIIDARREGRLEGTDEWLDGRKVVRKEGRKEGVRKMKKGRGRKEKLLMQGEKAGWKVY